MDRKLFGLFTGTHLTILTAILAPTALYGAVTYSNVAIVNPTTGVAAAVDAAGRLSAVNPYSLYRDYPANQIDIEISNLGNQCESTQQWAVPAGKAFIITGISGYVDRSDTAATVSGIYVWDKVDCTGHLLTTFAANVSTSTKYVPLVANYGVGIPVAAGSTLSVYSIYDYGYTHIHGYLVPAAWVSASQFQRPTSPGAAAKLAAMR